MLKVDEKSCPASCNTIVDSKDFHGCPVKSCKKKACPTCLLYDVEEDACGCRLCLKVKAEIVIQERTSVGNTDFAKNWNSYRDGFTASSGFWLGLKALHKITVANPGKCQLVLSSKRKDNGQWNMVVVDGFSVGADPYYSLSVGKIVEQYGSAFIAQNQINYHYGVAFSTYDRDQDLNPNRHCAQNYGKGGWWYHSGCYHFCLNCDPPSPGASETRMSIRIKP
jgi:hypothetical protein